MNSSFRWTVAGNSAPAHGASGSRFDSSVMRVIQRCVAEPGPWTPIRHSMTCLAIGILSWWSLRRGRSWMRGRPCKHADGIDGAAASMGGTTRDPVPAKELVLAKARDEAARIRLAALKILVNSSWGSPQELLQPFAKDLDPAIRKMLRAWGAA